MEQQYYWIEIKFPFSGFWGTAFKFWETFKRIKEKLPCKAKFNIFRPNIEKRIRSPA